MRIKRLELPTSSLLGQLEYYQTVLQLPATLEADSLIIQAGRTELIFKQAPNGWTGQYHFCFNIPENKFDECSIGDLITIENAIATG